MSKVKGKLYIGDNIEGMSKLELQGDKYDVIIVDPPYNTGNKGFTYSDNLSHEDWLEFMECRLREAYKLQDEEGIICITIDDRELYGLKLLMDKIYGKGNFLCNLVWDRKSTKNSAKYISVRHEYVLIYRKSSELKKLSKRFIEDTKRYNRVDEQGRRYAREKLDKSSLEYRKNNDYIIYSDSGEEIYPKNDKEGYIKRKSGGNLVRDWQWRYSYERYVKERSKGNIIIEERKSGGYNVYTKSYLDEKINTPYDSIFECHSKKGNDELLKMFGERVFDYVKPLDLIKHLIKLHPNQEGLRVLDIFAGSGTSGQAVVELSEEDGKKREFTLITLNEVSKTKEINYFQDKGLINIIGLSKKKQEEEFMRYKNSESYKEEIKSEGYQKLGIAESVTKPRLTYLKEGYINKKSKEKEYITGINYELTIEKC